MKTYETKDIPATTKQVCVAETCDICKKPIPVVGSWDVEEVGITARNGTDYGAHNGGCITHYGFDICFSCFEKVLTPFIEKHGSRVTKTVSEW